MRKYEAYFKKIALGSVLTVIILVSLSAAGNIYGEMILYETFPYYSIDGVSAQLFKWPSVNEDIIAVNATTNESPLETDTTVVNEITEELEVVVVGLEDIYYQEEADNTNIGTHFTKENLTREDIDRLTDLNFVKANFYTIDKKTGIMENDFDAESFLTADLTIDTAASGPKVLIFHTHSHEGYADSDKNDMNDGVILVGEKLKDILETKYNIKTVHNTARYDAVDGKPQIIGAYERVEPAIRKILKENPSIEVVIDLHRDGVSEDIRLVKELNGKPTAQIMFFNGLSKLNKDGLLTPLDNLYNPYITTNLAFSFNMQLTANELYPDFTRKIYLNAYRYSLHMAPKSLLVEVGAQTNTKQEALNAMEPLAEILAENILP